MKRLKTEPFSYVLVIRELKKILRAQRMTYAKLSKELDVPISTLKKWFTSTDGSLNRVALLCRAAEISLPDLLEKMSSAKVETFSFKDAQQSQFEKDWNLFSVYWFLVYERRSAEAVARQMGLSGKSFEQNLLKLDRLGLLKYGVSGKVTVPRARPVRWKPEGVFFNRVFDRWSRAVLLDSLNAQDQSQFVLQFFQLSEESLAELKLDLKTLEEKYARRTIQGLGIPGLPLRRFRFMISMAEGSFIK